MKTVVSVAFITVLVFPACLSAQSNVHMNILPSSHLTLAGTSTLHSYECQSTNIQGDIEMDRQVKAFTAAEVIIPVKSLHSESTSMDNNMYDALKAKDFPEIKFSLGLRDSASHFLSADNDTSMTLRGTLTIAGKAREIELKIAINRNKDGTASADGSKELFMTDYGIDPPTFMLGVLKTGNEVTVNYHLDLKSSAPVAHSPSSKN